MITDNNRIKKLLISIGIVLLLLCICVSVDYASDNETITAENINNISQYNATSLKLVNGTYYYLEEDSGIARIQNNGKPIEKPARPTITMTGKPSCSRCARNHCSYTWRTKSYVNYCPNCKHWNCLGNKHKRGAIHEKEISCFRCDSDFCINCGKEKYSWSRVRLRKA